MNKQREHFGGNFAAIMAFAGSAIGLGNIWRFPYMVGMNGGAAYIIVYICCTVLFALPVFFCETIIGKTSGQGPIGSMKTLAPGSKWYLFALLCVISPLIISSYYSIVGGWSIDYLLKSFTGNFGEFKAMSSSPWEPLVMHTAFLGLSLLVVVKGVKGGIERLSKMMTPLLMVLIVLLAIMSVRLPGAEEGVKFLVKPDFSKVNGQTVLFAMGQSFYSMSLGIGTVLTYSSYMRKNDSIVFAGSMTAIFDTMFAVIASFAILPAVFSAGLDPSNGPSLLFETLPFIFTGLGDSSLFFSRFLSIMFFFTVFCAALTSEISMLEACTVYFVEERKMSRKKAVAIIFAICWVIGALCSLSFGPLSNVKIWGNNIFSAFDYTCSNWLMIGGAIFFVIFVGWKMKKSDVMGEFTRNGSSAMSRKVFGIFYFLIKYVTPLILIMIFLQNIL